MKQTFLRKLLAFTLSQCMLVSALASGVSTATAAQGKTDSFSMKVEKLLDDPVMNQRVGARWWLAEGSHTNETLTESIDELYECGFGSVEVVTLDESAHLDNATYAWGSKEWVEDTQLIVDECTKRNMGVSFTSGTNWSTANLFTITPDEETAAQELGYQTVELTAGEEFHGVLPQVTLTQHATKMRLEKVIAAKKVHVDEKGVTTLAEDSLTDVTSLAKQDDNGNWTMDYTAPSDGEYNLFVFWQYGTSQTAAPAVSTAYTINYFSKQGTTALIDYWDKNVLTPEFKESIQQNGNVQMYMDSLELEPHGEDTTGNLWCADYLDQFESRRGYDMSLYLPLTIMKGYARMDNTNYMYELDRDSDLSRKLRNDQYQTNTELYMQNCLGILTDWLHSFDVTLRAENSYGTLLEISQPTAYLDHVETESLEFNGEIDSFRGQAGGAHLFNKVYSSETAAVAGGNYWDDDNTYRQLFYTQFASGIQKTMTHGYSSAYGPEQNCFWPGYEGMMDMFGNRFNKRQPASIDYKELWGQVNRIQTVLHQGVPQMDLGILRSDYNFECSLIRRGFRSSTGYSDVVKHYSDNDMRNQKAYYWKDMTLQNAGYTYDYFSPYLLQNGGITCGNGLVQADGVAYQALLIYQEEMPLASAQVLLDWAKDGLPLVLVTGPSEERTRYDVTKYNKSAAITTGSLDGKDAELAAVMEQVKAQPNVICVNSEAQAYDALQGMNIHPRAEYVESNQSLLTAMRKTEDATYLYVYHYMYEDEQNYTGQISLDGVYTPYLIDTWSGDVDQIGEYSCQNGKTVVNIDIHPGEVMVFALDPNGAAPANVVGKQNVEKVTVEDGNTILYVPESGQAKVSYSDGSVFDAMVEVPDKIELGNWNLTVQSWTPGEKLTRTEDKGYGYVSSEVTYDTNKTEIDVGQTELVPWKDIEKVGGTVSGVGFYTNSFTLPEDWNSTTQALKFSADSFGGGTAAVFVNGEQVPVDMNTCTADLSDCAVLGENSIEVRVTSSLRNIMLELGYAAKGMWSLLGENALEPDEYGMTGETGLKAYTKVVAEPAQMDKTILTAVLAYAEGVYLSNEFSNAIADVQASFTSALEQARSVHADLFAPQESIDQAWKNLMTEIHKLGFVRGDKSALSQLITAAEEYEANINRYTPATAQVFLPVLTAAKEVMNDGNAMRDDVAKAESELLDAMAQLRYKADKSVLEEILSEAAKIDTTQFTGETVALFNTAYSVANTVQSNENATQNEVDTAAENLKAAVDSLQAIESEFQVQGDFTQTSGSSNVKTGENTLIPLAVFAALLSASFVLSRKKR